MLFPNRNGAWAGNFDARRTILTVAEHPKWNYSVVHRGGTNLQAKEGSSTWEVHNHTSGWEVVLDPRPEQVLDSGVWRSFVFRGRQVMM